MTDTSFLRLSTGIIDTITTAQDNVKIFGSFPEAMKRGYKPVLMSHISQIRTLCSSLESLIKEHEVDGSYSVVAEKASGG